MDKFLVKPIKDADIINELTYVGFDSAYKYKASNKYKFKLLKVFNLTLPQANILKQTALSNGCDCAVNRDIVTAKTDVSDCILAGSFSQLKKIAKSLSNQQFGLKGLGEIIENSLKEKPKTSPKIVGILNLTSNSFSDGGKYLDFENASKHLIELIEDGADIIDIGAESTKPFSEPVSAENQLKLIVPILEFIKEKGIETPISIDTRSSLVAEKCLEYGVQIINDVSGLEYDDNMADVVSKCNSKIVIQHSKGTPENMQESPSYDVLVDEIFKSFCQKIDYAISKGIKRENIILDVGIGFGKTLEHNFELLKRIEEFEILGCSMMVGLSRKSLLGMKDSTNEEKDIYTVALNTLCIEKNVDYLRVHNVKMHKKLKELMENY